jgi:predicted alternative tryptophan synthase beta-subunit
MISARLTYDLGEVDLRRRALLRLQVREATEQRATAAAGSAGGGGTGGGLALELAAARRSVASLEESLAAEKGHSAQYASRSRFTYDLGDID